MRTKSIIRSIPPLYLGIICLIGLSLFSFIFFFAGRWPKAPALLNHYTVAAPLVFICILFSLVEFCAFTAYLSEKNLPLSQSLLALLPLAFLNLWPTDNTSLSLGIPLIIIMGTQIMLLLILAGKFPADAKSRFSLPLLLTATVIVYSVILGTIVSRKITSLTIFNYTDFALYNQSFWSAAHGGLFENTKFGSNFACHNTWFYYLLLPLYRIAPYPHTLSLIKILLLASSAIPFYLIAKEILGCKPSFFLIWSFLCFPYIISQNFTAPHEITYAPFFLLWMYYFFCTNRFFPFLIMLLICLSIKEHIAFISVMFGIYAWYSRKDKRWILTPIILGAIWAVFSMWVIWNFQTFYHSHTNAHWVSVSLQRRFALGEGNIMKGIIEVIASSNITDPASLKLASLLFIPLGIVPPFLSTICLLGLPELLLNLIGARKEALLGPMWHYNMVVSCFLLLGTVEGIKVIALTRWAEKLNLDTKKAHYILSVLIFSLIIIHSHLWLGAAMRKENPRYLKAAYEAIALIPKDASVTAPRSLTLPLSNRKECMIWGIGELGEYLIVDSESALKSKFDATPHIPSYYRKIFRKNGIVVYKREH